MYKSRYSVIFIHHRRVLVFILNTKRIFYDPVSFCVHTSVLLYSCLFMYIRQVIGKNKADWMDTPPSERKKALPKEKAPPKEIASATSTQKERVDDSSQVR